MYQQKVIKTGNSLALTIPAKFVKDLGIRAGDSVKTIFEREKGRIIYIFSGIKQLPLSESFFQKRK